MIPVQRVSAIAVVGAMALAGCRVPGQWFPGHGVAKPSGVHIVAPTNATQAPASGDINLDVRLDANLDAMAWRIRAPLAPALQLR